VKIERLERESAGRMRRMAAGIAAAGLLSSSGCINGSGSLPPPAPSVTVTSISITGAGTGNPGQSVQLTASATLSDDTVETVTSKASWTSANTAVATVSASGVVQLIATGEAEIRATYQSVTATAKVTVTPAPVPRHTLAGRVTNADSDRAIENARVEVIDGPDAGRSSSTSAQGDYRVENLTEGTISVRVSHDEFVSVERSVTLAGDVRLDVELRPTVNVSELYGTYNITFSVEHQNCTPAVIPGPTGTVQLEGDSDGQPLKVTIRERGSSRRYSNGRLKTDGSFNASGSGVILGIITSSVAGNGLEPLHDFSGSVRGTVRGRSISGTEDVTFGAPCPGKTATIKFSGSR
jgi:hypothetical protein